MPLSPNVQRIADALRIDADEAAKAGVAAFAVPADATDEQALALSADRLAKVASVVTALSADVERLEGELEAANEAVESKGREVLSLSATNPKKLDPVNLGMFRRNVNQARERALGAGVPPELTKAIDGRLFSGAEKSPTVFALSADGPEGEPAAFWIYDLLADLAAGKWGKGVMTGAATRGKPVFQASATASDDGPDADTLGEWDKQDEALKNRLLATAKRD